MSGDLLLFSRYLGKDLSVTEIEKVVEHTSFKYMKEHFQTKLRDSVANPNYMRKGDVGDFVNGPYTEEQLKVFNHRIETRFKHTGFYTV